MLIEKLYLLFFFVISLAHGKNVFSPKGLTAIWDLLPGTGILNGSGTWNDTAPNFNYNTLGTLNSPFAPGSNVSFGKPGSSVGGGTVVVSGAPKLINGFIFDTGPTTDYVLSGGTLSCVNDPACTYTANKNGTIGSVITGSLPLIKEGTQTLILSGANTYTGNTSVNAGTLSLGDGTAGGNIIPESNLISDNATLTYNTGSNITHSGIISGTGKFTKEGSGTLALTATNTYTGVTTVSAGTLQLGDGTASGAIIPTANTIANSAALIYNTPSTISHSGGISGVGTFTKQGTGTLTLSGYSSYTGNTTVSEGTLSIGNGATPNNIIPTANTITTNAALIFNNPSDITHSGAIGGTGTLEKRGGGILSLTADHRYSGTTTVTGGTLKFIHTSNDRVRSIGYSIAGGTTLQFDIPSVSGRIARDMDPNITGTGTFLKTGPVILYMANNSPPYYQAYFNMGAGGLVDVQVGTLSSIATLPTNLADLNINTGATVTINDGGAPDPTAYFDKLLGGGTIVQNANVATRTLSVGNNDGTANFTGVVGDSASGGVLSFTKAGDGTQTLSGVNTYTGITTISSGTLILGDGSAGGNIIPAANLITDNATLTYNTGSNITHSGEISGTGKFIKLGTGNLTLTDQSFYSGGTTVNGGTLSLAGVGGATTSIIKGDLIINSGGTVNAPTNDWTLGYSESAAQAVKSITINGGTLNFTGADSGGGTNSTITMTNGSITGSLFDYYRPSGARTITINPGTSTISSGMDHRIPGGLTFDVAAGGTLNFSGRLSQEGTPGNVIKAGPGPMNMTGVNSYTVNTTISEGTFQIGGAGSLGSGSYAGAISIASGATLTYSSSVDQTFSGVISSAGALIKDTSAASTLTISAVPTSTGPISVSSGTLLFQNSATGGPQINSNISVATGATLSFNKTANFTSANAPSYKNVSGAGSVIVNGPNSTVGKVDGGWTMFAGTVNLTGSIDVQSGILASQVGADWTGTTASLNVASGAQFLIHLDDATVGALTGGGNIGTGYNNPQTLTIGAGGGSGTFSGVIEGVGGAGNVDIAVAPITLVKTGTGTQTFSGKNRHTGGTVISGGTLKLTNTSNDGTSFVGTGTVTIRSGATLQCLSGNNCLGHGDSARVPQLDIDGGTFTASPPYSGGLWFETINFLNGGLVDGGNGINAKILTTNVPASINVNASTSVATISTQIRNDIATGEGLVLTVNNGIASPDLLISGLIYGAGILTKEGAGELILTGANTYTGTTSINGGYLGGNGASSSAATVGVSGAVFGGTGGGNAGTATFGSITFSSTGSAMNIYSDGTNLSKVDSNGACTMGGAGFNLIQAGTDGNKVVLQCGAAPTGQLPTLFNSSGKLATLYQSGNNFVIGVGIGALDLLAVSSPSGAYSLRKIRSGYPGNAIRVRRSSDGNFQDIGFTDSGDLDVTALTNFVGAGNNGFVHTWYDQSTHNRPAIQATAANQPQIVNAGAVITSSRSGIPSMQFSGSQWLDTGTNLQNMTTGGKDGSVIAVMKAAATSNAAFGAYLTDGSGNRWSAHLIWTTSQLYMDLGDVATDRVSADATANVDQWRRYSFIHSGDTATLRWSGSQQTQKTTASAASTATGNFLIGYASNAGVSLNSITGNISEFIIYPNGLSFGEFTILESSQGSYWQVP